MNYANYVTLRIHKLYKLRNLYNSRYVDTLCDMCSAPQFLLMFPAEMTSLDLFDMHFIILHIVEQDLIKIGRK